MRPIFFKTKSSCFPSKFKILNSSGNLHDNPVVKKLQLCNWYKNSVRIVMEKRSFNQIRRCDNKNTSIEPVPSNKEVVIRILPPEPPPVRSDPPCPLELKVPSTLISVVKLKYRIPPPHPPIM